MSESVTPWIPGERTELASTRILTLYEQRFDCPDHPERSGSFTVIDLRDWINLIALTDPADDPLGPRLIMVEQYRFGRECNTLEVVAGIIDEGESPMEAGPRELLEETGYAGGTPEVLGVVDANPALMTNQATTLLIPNCRKVADPSFDANEQLVTRLVRLDEIRDLVSSGHVRNAIVVAALFHYLAG